jgi:N-acetylneuraminic acid mutarotase
MRSRSRSVSVLRVALIPLFLLGLLGVALVASGRARALIPGRTPSVSANAERWSMLAPLPVPRQETAVAELNGRVYVIGGMLTDGTTTDTVEAYDPATDRWSAVAPLPAPRHHTNVAAVGGKLYVMGGLVGFQFAPVDTVFEYDPASDRWTSRASMPTARGAMGVAALDGRIYVAGGSPDPNERDLAAYDPATDAWEALPAMPTPRNHLAAAATAGRFYAIGGRSGAIGGITSVVEAYDPASRTWSTRPAMPTARGGQAAAVVDGCIYVVGGENNRGHPLGMFEQNEVFEPISESWRSLEPMMLPLHGMGAAGVGARIHVTGGGQVEGLAATPAHEVFDATGTCGD